MLVAGCDPDVQAPPPEDAEPFALLKKYRVAPVDVDAHETLEASPKMDVSEVADAYERVLLRSQLWDQETVRLPGGGDASFEARISHLKGEADRFGSFSFLVSLDLLKRDSSGVFCAPDVFDDTRCKITLRDYRDRANEQIRVVADQLKPELFIVGAGMNRIAATDPTAHAEFLTWFAEPVVNEGVGPSGTDVTTSIDWEVFVLDAEARAAALVEEGAASPAALDQAYQEIWDEQLGPVADHLAVVAVESVPTVPRVVDLPDDYYGRLRALIPENKPVAFVRVGWPSRSENDTLEAGRFLHRFRCAIQVAK